MLETRAHFLKMHGNSRVEDAYRLRRQSYIRLIYDACVQFSIQKMRDQSAVEKETVERDEVESKIERKNTKRDNVFSFVPV